jgi:hypothetical protein
VSPLSVYRADCLSDGHRIGERLMNPGYEPVRNPYERLVTLPGEYSVAAAADTR